MAEPTDPNKTGANAKSGVSTDAPTGTPSDVLTDAPSDVLTDAPSDVLTDAPSGKSGSVPEAGSGTHGSISKEALAEASVGGSARVALWLVIIAALAGGGAFTSKHIWMPLVQPYLAYLEKIPGPGGASLESPSAGSLPMDKLSKRIAALEQKLAPKMVTDDEMLALKAEKDRIQGEMTRALGRISDLERRLKEVRGLAQAATSGGDGQIDLSPVMSRIDQLEDSGRQTTAELAALSDRLKSGLQAGTAGYAGYDSGQASGLVLAIARLRDTALSGQPYAAQLEAVRILAGNNTDYMTPADRLAATADTGLPTVDDVSDAFRGVAGDVIALARSEGGDWLQQTMVRVSSLISIRRTDGQSGDPLENALAEIETRLAARDVPMAVQIARTLSDTLSGKAHTALESWLRDAEARADAERALDAIHTTALAGIGG